jgi:hypothetical protein
MMPPIFEDKSWQVQTEIASERIRIKVHIEIEEYRAGELRYEWPMFGFNTYFR